MPFTIGTANIQPVKSRWIRPGARALLFLICLWAAFGLGTLHRQISLSITFPGSEVSDFQMHPIK